MRTIKGLIPELIWTTLGLVLIVAGGIGLSITSATAQPNTIEDQPIIHIAPSANVASNQTTTDSHIDTDIQLSPTVASSPNRISLPRLNINLPVANGYYDEQAKKWTLSANSAYFATITHLPNDKEGMTFIYGHATPKIFGKLPSVRINDIAVISTSSGEEFVYRFRNSFTTTPEKSDFLNYQGAPILALQTCSGIWSQYRTIYLFEFVEMKND